MDSADGEVGLEVGDDGRGDGEARGEVGREVGSSNIDVDRTRLALLSLSFTTRCLSCRSTTKCAVELRYSPSSTSLFTPLIFLGDSTP